MMRSKSNLFGARLPWARFSWARFSWARFSWALPTHDRGIFEKIPLHPQKLFLLGNFCKNSPNPKNFYPFISPLEAYRAVFSSTVFVGGAHTRQEALPPAPSARGFLKKSPCTPKTFSFGEFL